MLSNFFQHHDCGKVLAGYSYYGWTSVLKATFFAVVAAVVVELAWKNTESHIEESRFARLFFSVLGIATAIAAIAVVFVRHFYYCEATWMVGDLLTCQLLALSILLVSILFIGSLASGVRDRTLALSKLFFCLFHIPFLLYFFHFYAGAHCTPVVYCTFISISLETISFTSQFDTTSSPGNAVSSLRKWLPRATLVSTLFVLCLDGAALELKLIFGMLLASQFCIRDKS